MKQLDSKDYAILKELDKNFRISFSKIAKKVKLSKNSVALRFDKLKESMLHNVTGINNEILGYTMVKVFYNFNYFDEKVEGEIINELKKYKSIRWVAKFYGTYDLCICLLVDNLDSLITQIDGFNEKFSDKINQKEIQIVLKQFYFRHNFIKDDKNLKVFKIEKTNHPKINLTEIEKKILSVIRYNPRISLIDIANKVGITTKTVSNNIKYLEKKKVIMGYFMKLNPLNFKHSEFKLLVQLRNLEMSKEFESYLISVNNVEYVTKMIGPWDYEIDCAYLSINELQKQIEQMKQKFPNAFKEISILSFDKRIVTNKESFLEV